MSRFGWWMVDLASRMLEPGDRESALGDVAESSQTAPRALRDVLDLVVRRLAVRAKANLPWLAMLALIATLLSRALLQLDLSLQGHVRTYWVYHVLQDTGMSRAQEFLMIGILMLALFAWVWTSGFVLASLSGRAVWITGALFYFLVVNWPLVKPLMTGSLNLHHVGFSWIVVQAVLPFSFERGWCLLAGIWGARRGLRCRTMDFREAVWVAGLVVILTGLATWSGGWTQQAHLAWSEGLWRGPVVPWYTRLAPFAVMCWPAFYMAATARRGPRPTVN